MSEHTKEPWTYVDHSWSDTSIYFKGESVAVLSIAGVATEESQNDLERIQSERVKHLVNSSNACANIKKPSAIKGVIDAFEILLRRLYDREVPDCLFDYGDSAESVNQLRDFMHEVRQALNALNGE